MKSSTQFVLANNFALLLVGEPKTGKTNILFAFPGLYILDCDMNLASAIRRAPGKDFKYDQLSVGDDGKPIVESDRWSKAIVNLKAAILDPTVQTIAIDGLGVLTDCLMDHIVAQSIKSGTCKSGKMEIQHYGELIRILKTLAGMLRACGKLVVVTSHQTSDKDEATGIIRYFLAIPGQSRETFGGLFTDVWATTCMPSGIGEHKYAIATKPTGRHVSLGTSFDLAASIDITNKKPAEIWSLISPKLGLATTSSTQK